MFVPTHVTADPGTSIMPLGTKMRQVDLIDVKPIDNSPDVEELRAYHASLDRINALINPDMEDERWKIASIEKHLVRERKDGSCPIYLKIAYSDGGKAYQPLDIVRTHDPMIAAHYAIMNRLAGLEGWQWVPHYINLSPVCQALHAVFRVSVKGERKFKFGVEVPHNPRHALELDKDSNTDGWKNSMVLEINQLNEYKTF